MEDRLKQSIPHWKSGDFFRYYFGRDDVTQELADAKVMFEEHRSLISDTFRYVSSDNPHAYSYNDIKPLVVHLSNGIAALYEQVLLYGHLIYYHSHSTTGYEAHMILRGVMEALPLGDALDTIDSLSVKYLREKQKDLVKRLMSDDRLRDASAVSHLRAVSLAAGREFDLSELRSFNSKPTSVSRVPVANVRVSLVDALLVAQLAYDRRLLNEDQTALNVRDEWFVTLVGRSAGLCRNRLGLTGDNHLFSSKNFYPRSTTLLGFLYLITSNSSIDGGSYDSRYDSFVRVFPLVKKVLGYYDASLLNLIIDDVDFELYFSDLIMFPKRPTVNLLKDYRSGCLVQRARCFTSQSLVAVSRDLGRRLVRVWPREILLRGWLYMFIVMWYYAIFGTAVHRVEKRPRTFEIRLGDFSYSLDMVEVEVTFNLLQVGGSRESSVVNVRRTFMGMLSSHFRIFKSFYNIRLPSKWWLTEYRSYNDDYDVDWFKYLTPKDDEERKLLYRIWHRLDVGYVDPEWHSPGALLHA